MKKLVYLACIGISMGMVVSCTTKGKTSLTEEEKDSIWCDTTTEVCGVTEDMDNIIPDSCICPD